MTSILDKLDPSKGNINGTAIIAVIVALGAIIFGIQQCHNNTIAKGDIQALVHYKDSITYWKDKYGVEHARAMELLSSIPLDTPGQSKGKVTGITGITSKGHEVLLPDTTIPPLTFSTVTDTANYWELVDEKKNTWIWHAKPIWTPTNKQDTLEYRLTAQDTLEWLRAGTRTYATKWDTIRVSYDSATLVVNDKLHIVESRVREGGLFNRRFVPYVDVYHENPMLRTTDIRAWRLSVPTRHWAIGPSVNVYPRFSNGIKFGASFGLALTYSAITF